MSRPAASRATAGRWREAGSSHVLVRLDVPAVTPGMVVVTREDEDWRCRPALRWQAWPDDLAQKPVCDTPQPTAPGDGRPGAPGAGVYPARHGPR
jgi:hypothetical protein